MAVKVKGDTKLLFCGCCPKGGCRQNLVTFAFSFPYFLKSGIMGNVVAGWADKAIGIRHVSQHGVTVDRVAGYFCALKGIAYL